MLYGRSANVAPGLTGKIIRRSSRGKDVKISRPEGASLSGLLFRRGAAPPHTPPCQRNNIPLDFHYCRLRRSFFLFLFYHLFQLSVCPESSAVCPCNSLRRCVAYTSRCHAAMRTPYEHSHIRCSCRL